jgi:hypothetical protein
MELSLIPIVVIIIYLLSSIKILARAGAGMGSPPAITVTQTMSNRKGGPRDET